jgi:hypothetical protein
MFLLILISPSHAALQRREKERSNTWLSQIFREVLSRESQMSTVANHSRSPDLRSVLDFPA